jgi:nonspecific dipeptidase
MNHGAKAWVADFNHPHYQAAKNAIVKGILCYSGIFANEISFNKILNVFFFYFLVFGIEPDFTREGCSIPVTLTFQELTGKNVLLLPIGSILNHYQKDLNKINVYISIFV